jgi:hypothetical protein
MNRTQVTDDPRINLALLALELLGCHIFLRGGFTTAELFYFYLQASIILARFEPVGKPVFIHMPRDG